MRVLRRELRLRLGDSNLLLIKCHREAAARETAYVGTPTCDNGDVFTMNLPTRRAIHRKLSE